jgi:hypothetical protein
VRTCLSIFVVPRHLILTKFSQTAWDDFKPQLGRTFAEGLDGYDVSRCIDTVTVFRPTLAEIEAGWEPKNAAHEEEDEEEDEALYQWHRVSPRVRIPDV